MRIHTNDLSMPDLEKAMQRASGKAPHVVLYVLGHHGSRSHKRAYEVALRGYGSRHTRPAQNRELDGKAATRDDWGYFMAAVFAVDPDATFGPYQGIEDFNYQTDGQYVIPYFA